MASSASMPAPAKRLKEHLQDQQEPFNLHSYLSERSYVKTSCSLDHSVDSAKNPTRPPSSGIHKGRNGILHAKTILASAMYKLIPTNTSREYPLCSKRNQGLTNVGTTIAFEFGNSETVETATDTRFHWICVEDHSRLRSASLLREALSNKAGDFNKKSSPIRSQFHSEQKRCRRLPTLGFSIRITYKFTN